MIGGALIAYRWELRKLTAQRRNWLGIVAAALVPESVSLERLFFELTEEPAEVAA
jgi:hypothetical protein